MAHKYITKQEYIVGIINSIADKHPLLRQKSKPASFALQYLGTWHTLHKRTGFPVEEAKNIEKAYHELYAVSAEFAEKNKQFMVEHGYIECAFGLQLQTPIVRQCILGTSKTPREADAEVRSANNAVTQSWGMLLNRAIIATNNRIEEVGLGTQILPINMIHDAAYFLVKKNPIAVEFLNRVLIEEMSWNDHDLIRSMDVPMCAELQIGKAWSSMKTLPNNTSIKDIEIFLKEIG